VDRMIRCLSKETGVGSLNHRDPAKVAPHCGEVSTFALVTMHKGDEVMKYLKSSHPLLPLQFLFQGY
jgi:hypothetical protein